MSDELLLALDAPLPRYTSYPPATCFVPSFGEAEYRAALAARDPARSLALYTHIPFCESLCRYCGCNVVIGKSRDRADRYLDSLAKEAELVAAALPGPATYCHVHLGGGSPNFLTPAQLDRLLGVFARHFRAADTVHRSVEVHPAFTSDETLAHLAHAGFDRISLGVQDLEPEVLAIVSRQKPAEFEAFYDRCRQLGFTSINFDLMYGLPAQTVESLRRTMTRVAELGPDRIAFFGYAHVPNLRPQQRLLPEDRLPGPAERFRMLAAGREILEAHGYEAVGIDHYAKRDDPMAKAARARVLRRSFQGYTADPGDDLIGLGASAIGSVGPSYAQNSVELDAYAALVDAGRLPVVRGLTLTTNDEVRRGMVMDVMCHGELALERLPAPHREAAKKNLEAAGPELDRLAERGLLLRTETGLRATPIGTYFLRSIANVFDDTTSKHRGSRAF